MKRSAATPLLIALLSTNIGCALASGDWERDERTPDPKEREAWRSHLAAGEAAQNARCFEGAEREFLAAIGSIAVVEGNESEILEALRRLARLYDEGGRPDQTRSVLEKAHSFALSRLGSDHSETRLVVEAQRRADASVTIATDPPELQEQEQERKSEFRNNVNLWPFIESTTLPSGEHRTALWPLFHWTVRPDGETHSWHVLNFLSGPRYHMLLPLYYSVDEELSLLPLLTFIGPDYWTSFPLLSGSSREADGGRTTWLTPLFHESTNAKGEIRSLHAGLYFQGPDWWAVPPLFLEGPDYWGAFPLLSGSWTYRDGDHTTWLTPLFHVTTERDGATRSLHAGIYFQGEDSWSLPPLLTWHKDFPDGAGATWATPL